MFQRDQPRIRHVFEWNRQLVVETDRFYALDLEKAVAAPLRVGEGQEVLGLATHRGRPVALCRNDGILVLLARKNAEWVELQIPETLRKVAKPVLCATTSDLVLLTDDALWRLDAGAWKRVPLRNRSQIGLIEMFDHEGGPSHYLLLGQKLYVGYDHGEWGGALLSLDANSGKWQEEQQSIRVRDLKLGPDGTLWVVDGLSHLGAQWGSLHTSDGKSWKTFSNSTRDEFVNWNLGPSCLDALAFDVEQRLYVLSEALGLARYNGHEWEWLTPAWPKHKYVSCLHITSQGMAVIGMSDAGILLLDLESKRVQRVVLR